MIEVGFTRFSYNSLYIGFHTPIILFVPFFSRFPVLLPVFKNRKIYYWSNAECFVMAFSLYSHTCHLSMFACINHIHFLTPRRERGNLEARFVIFKREMDSRLEVNFRTSFPENIISLSKLDILIINNFVFTKYI